MSKETLIASVRSVVKNSPAAQIRGTKLADKLEEIIEACFNSDSEIVEVAASRDFLASDANKILWVTAPNVELTMPEVNPFTDLSRVTIYPIDGTKFNTLFGIPLVSTLSTPGGNPFIELINTNGILYPKNGVILDDTVKTFEKYVIEKVGPSGTATLVAGTVTVADARVKTGAKIIVSVNTPGGTQGFLSAPVASIVDETSFVINSSSATETSTVNYWFVNP